MPHKFGKSHVFVLFPSEEAGDLVILLTVTREELLSEREDLIKIVSSRYYLPALLRFFHKLFVCIVTRMLKELQSARAASQRYASFQSWDV